MWFLMKDFIGGKILQELYSSLKKKGEKLNLLTKEMRPYFKYMYSPSLELKTYLKS